MRLHLGARSKQQLAAAIPDPIRLGSDDIAALRDALCEDLFIGFPGDYSMPVCRLQWLSR